MRKITFLKSLLLLCALIAGSTAWANVSTLTFTTKCNGSGTADDGAVWTVTSDGEESTIDNTKGIHYGTNSKAVQYIKLTTSDISGTITKVVVNASTANAVTATASVTVDGEAFGGDAKDLTSTAADYTFNGSASGEIVVTVTKPSQAAKAIYVKSITVTYTPSGDPSKADPELSFAKASYEATYGVEFTPPTLNHAAGFTGTVEYTSSDESVARVYNSETGELTITGGGKTTITASFAGNETYNAGSASYTLTVTDNRIATTTKQENIVLELADVATLTRLAPVVIDAGGNVIAYQYDEWPTEMSFEVVSDPNYINGSLDNNTGEITLNAVTGTLTMKAIYNSFGVNKTYKPSECTFTITVVSLLDNISALTAETEAGTYKVNLDNAVVTFVYENYAYIQDASGAVAMYKKGHGLTAGEVLNGKAIVAYQLRNKNPQITDLSGVTPTAGEAPDPTVIAAEDWNYTFTDVLSQYFQVTGATITKEDTKYYTTLNGDKIQLYKVGDALGDIDLTKTYTITGFPTLYNSTKELQIYISPEEEAVPVTITATKYATFVSSKNVDFSTSGITAYTAQVSGSSVTLTEITKVPANTPVVVYKADANGIAVRVPTTTSPEEVGTNELQISDGTVTGGDGIYALASKGEPAVVGFYKVKNTVTIPAGKCYLNTTATARDFLSLGDETTGISTLTNSQEQNANNQMFDLQGRRVAQPTKGLYIVNGKKVIVK